MKKNIHPKTHDLTVQCRCGNYFVVLSTLTQKSLNAESCGKCFSITDNVYKGQQEGTSARERLFRNFSISNLEGESTKD